MDETYTEWSKAEKEKYHPGIAYMWQIERVALTYTHCVFSWVQLFYHV